MKHEKHTLFRAMSAGIVLTISNCALHSATATTEAATGYGLRATDYGLQARRLRKSDSERPDQTRTDQARSKSFVLRCELEQTRNSDVFRMTLLHELNKIRFQFYYEYCSRIKTIVKTREKTLHLAHTKTNCESVI